MRLLSMPLLSAEEGHEVKIYSFSEPEVFLRKEERVETEIAGLRHWAQDFVECSKCGPARDARMIDRDPLPPAAILSKESRRNLDWVELFIEIAEGPIRWVNLGSEIGYRFGSLYVPDSRIHAVILLPSGVVD